MRTTRKSRKLSIVGLMSYYVFCNLLLLTFFHCGENLNAIDPTDLLVDWKLNKGSTLNTDSILFLLKSVCVRDETENIIVP